MRQPTKGPVLKERVWCFLEALLTHAEDSSDFEVHWEDEDTGRPKLVVKTRRRFLEGVAKVKQSQIYEVINSLKKLEILEDRRFKQKRGSDVWCFALKLWSRDAQRNREQFERVWEGSRTAKSKALEATYNKSKDSAEASHSEIDWHNICLAMLEKQKRLTTNELLSADEDMKFELDDIHVPLALVQRTKPDKRSRDVSPEEGSRLLQPTYEEKQRFRHEDFLAQVLHEGKGRRIAVIGEPGAGKTTLLQSIAFWILDNNLGLPIWISLADLQGKTLEEYLLQRWLKNALEVVRVTPEQENAFVELFKNNRVWLFLDGVDEIVGGSVGVGAHSCAPLQMIASQLEGWVAKARVVLSCRLNVWEANINALGDDFETYRLLDFDYPLQVKEFICRWFRKTDADKAERLWAELDKSERQRIQDLVKNPLRLALLCSTWQSSDKGLPSTKAGLYQRFVEVFYTWKKNRFPTTFEKRQKLNAALGRLALRAIDSEESRFRLRHKVVCEVLGDPEQEGSLFGLALQLGWLNQVGLAAESETQEKVYAFYHPTFQEYFAALAIDDWDFFLPRAHDNHNPKPASERYRIFEPQWKEVILLWLGREEVAKEQKEEFIQALVKFDDGCGCDNLYGCLAYFLAAAGIAEFEGCSYSAAIVAQIVKWSLIVHTSGRTEQTCWAAIHPIRDTARTRLLETNHNMAVSNLIKLVNNKDTSKQEAVELIEKIGIGNSDAINALTAWLQTSQKEAKLENLEIDWADLAVAKCLIHINPGNRTAINFLTDIMRISLNMNREKSEQQRMSRWLAAWLFLGQIDSENLDAIATLINCFQDDSLINVAIPGWTLRDLCADNPNVIKMLTKLLGTLDTSEHNVKRALNFALSEIVEGIGVGNLEAIEALIHLLHNSQDKYTLRQIICSLEKISVGNPEAIKALIELLHARQDERIRLQLATSLSKIDAGNSEAIKALNELLYTYQDKDTLRQTICSLEKIDVGNPEAIKTLNELLHTSQDERIQLQVATSLLAIEAGNPGAIKVLNELLHTSQDERIRLQVATSLLAIDTSTSDALATLIYLLHNSKNKARHIRKSAYETLWEIAPSNPTAMVALIDLLRSGQAATIGISQVDSFLKIIRNNQLQLLVASLKNCLKEKVQENNIYHDSIAQYSCAKEVIDIFWHCAQNMTYQAFYQAWHQQEGVGKTTTSDSQSLNQADLPQNLQSAIANDPQLSQIIHLICIDGSQFIERDRPAAEIYDQMLDQNCPECDSVPETMPALKLYWNSLKRNSDKRPVLVFYASSTEPYSEAFLTDLSKFGGAICCVVTSPPTPLLPGEGSKSDSCSPSSLQGEGVRGWGSLQFFAPSQAIADVVEWIRVHVIEE